jgi:ribosome-associated heat shock protein Hsp15
VLRLDLFLTHSRLVKRRGLAQALIEAGGVRVGGVPAKAGRKLSEGDEIELTLGARELKVRVMSVEGRRQSKAQAQELYEVIEEHWSEAPPPAEEGEGADGPIDFLAGR